MYLDRLLTLRHASRFVRAFAVVAALLVVAGPLGGCAKEWQETKDFVSNAADVVGGVKIKSKTAYVAINVFNAVEASVTVALRQPLCPKQQPLCRPLGFAAAVEQPFETGIAARNAMREWMKANPGTVADAGLYNSLVAATAAMKKVMAAYNINTDS